MSELPSICFHFFLIKKKFYGSVLDVHSKHLFLSRHCRMMSEKAQKTQAVELRMIFM